MNAMISTCAPTIDLASVAARTKLCTLTLSAWRATRLHKAETKAENERHSTDRARVAVRVCDHPALTELAKLHDEAYRAHRRLTLPSIQEGMRLLPIGREFEHTAEMRTYHAKHDAIVARFLGDYDAERNYAPIRLNGLYDPAMWPHPSQIGSKFGFRTRYMACPTDGSWGGWLEESARAAELELRQRLTEALVRVRDRCAGDGPLHATVFSAIQDLIALAPDLDLTGAPDVAAVVQAAGSLTSVTADEARADDSLRARTADEASRILSILGGVS